MESASLFFEAIYILLAVVVAVAVFQRLRLASVLAYLCAGIVIGPHALGLVVEFAEAEALGELGVVFLLFAVGLELPLERLKVMRGALLGFGGAQVALSTAALIAVFVLSAIPVTVAVIAGLALALSSTSVVLQLLTDRGGMNTNTGRSAFGVLLFQDLMVGPMLVVVLALSAGEGGLGADIAIGAAKGLAAMVLIFMIGRLVLRPLFSRVAALRNTEVFTALTFLVILTIGVTTELAGLSMAFGAFLAGVLLAETTFRHQVASVIQPFRGLLIGFYFVLVGMALDLGFVAAHIEDALFFLTGLLVIKAIIIALLALTFGYTRGRSLELGLLLCQGGEFAFVLLGAAEAQDPGAAAIYQVLTAVVALSMLLTPLLAAVGRALARRIDHRVAIQEARYAIWTDHVIIAGYGRAGRAVAGHLAVEGVAHVIIDLDPGHVADARRDGHDAIFGDATRPEILDTVNVGRARAIVIAFDDPRLALRLVSLLRYVFPKLPIFARAHDDAHAAELSKAGADGTVPELNDSAIRLATSALSGTTVPTDETERPSV